MQPPSCEDEWEIRCQRAQCSEDSDEAKFMVSNVTQSLGRQQIRVDGHLPTLTTGCKLFSFYQGKVLSVHLCMCAQGFMPTCMNLSSLQSQVSYGKLYGNAMTVPVIGAMVCSLLAFVPTGHDHEQFLVPQTWQIAHPLSAKDSTESESEPEYSSSDSSSSSTS